MAKGRTGHMYTDDALKAAMVLDRETYKKIKHMDKVELSNYLSAIYLKGREAGMKAASGIAETVKAVTNAAPPSNIGSSSASVDKEV